MSVEWNRFWCRVLFKEFIKHFRKLNDEQIVKDVRQSMDDLEDLVPDTDSFGSQMVRWSLERADEPFAVAARENGKKGGRPRKDSVEDGARESEQRTEANSGKGIKSAQAAPSHKDAAASVRIPPSKTEFMDWVCLVGIDEVFARRCYEMCEMNGWKDKNGKDIGDWRKFTYGFVKDQLNKRKKTA